MRNRDLYEAVLHANLLIPTYGLAALTWGNVSGCDREAGLYVIKPSGVAYAELTVDHLVPVDIETGQVISGTWKPSTDSETHRLLYQSFGWIGGVTHTHSNAAVAFAQAGVDLHVLGTTHADTFNGPVRCTRQLSAQECESEYELNTGRAVVELFASEAESESVPGALAVSHGPFTWGADPVASVNNALVCETVAQMALMTLSLNPEARAPRHLAERHFSRKHGSGAYYGN